VKRAHIEAGVAGFVEKFEVVSLIEIFFGVSAMDSRQSEWLPRISQPTSDQGTHPPGGGTGEVQAPSLHPQRIQETRSVQANEVPPIKRLGGEVTRLGETPFAGGTYCEVWMGRWVKQGGEKGSGEKIGREKVEVEKVSLSLTTSILLTVLFVGGLESTSNGATGEGA